MAARLFQSILLEIKDKVPFVVGVVDQTGSVIACTEIKLIGENVEGAPAFFAAGKDCGEHGGYMFQQLKGYENGVEYATFCASQGEMAETVCALASIAISNSKSLYEEKHDRAAFIKRIILSNILTGDIYIKSREMHFQNDAKRVVYLIRLNDRQDAQVVEALGRLFPDRQKDFAITINENEVVLVKELKTGDQKEIVKVGKSVDSCLSEELGVQHIIGMGTVAGQLKDIARSFKEAQMAVDIGQVFYSDKTLISFENLGIGRLIYQLPTPLCEMFLSEVFKKGSIESLDEETLFTIQKFFENNLNVSETSRKLFVHRNTLVYRLEKIKKLTGLDLREFDNAIVLKTALMVKQYLKSRENY